MPDRSDAAPIRVGIFAVGISGPGTGAWSRLESLCTALSRRSDVEVNVRLSDSSHAPRLAELGIETSVIPPVGRLRRLLGSSRMQKQFVAEAHLDVLQVETPPVGRGLPVPTLYSVHDLRSFHKPLRTLSSSAEILERLHVKTDITNADVTLTLSEASRSDITRYASDTAAIEILPAPVNPAPDKHPPRPDALVGQRRFVLALGHLEQRKNLEVLVRAATSASWPSDTTLVVAGADHGSATDLRNLAGQHGTDVVFTGTVTEEDKWALLTHAEVVAVPSLVEGFGIVAVEAALAGTPVLVSDRTSLPGIYNMPEIVLAADDPKAWAQGISRVVTDAEWAQSIAAQQLSIAADYGPDAVADQLVDIYRSLLAPSRPR